MRLQGAPRPASLRQMTRVNAFLLEAATLHHELQRGSAVSASQEEDQVQWHEEESAKQSWLPQI